MYGVPIRTDKGGEKVELVQTFANKLGEMGINFLNFVQTSFMEGPNKYISRKIKVLRIVLIMVYSDHRSVPSFP